ncbi:hypothetical protein VCRA2110O319_50043 [Vibrio crassostreae]|nr:hypothetical protein VCRA2110O319_50043 [Vibrio crassostreae]
MSKLRKPFERNERDPRAISEDTELKVIAALKEGYTQRSIAAEYEVSLSTVAKIAKKLRESGSL